ncbi:MAG: acetyl-CoA carboxylase biotin carboxyl carrier protein [Rhodospirillaceae bacterium]
MALTYKEVSEILKMIDASQADEVVLETGGTRLVVRRRGAAPQPAPAAQPAPAKEIPAAPPPASAAASAAATPVGAQAADGQTAVRAPMVGTFYRRPAPGEPVFVEQGSRVKKGDALCLIEVMKLYTTIEATADGVIETICAEDGSLVEFDQILFLMAAS